MVMEFVVHFRVIRYSVHENNTKRKIFIQNNIIFMKAYS
ncbi:hypothetical protein KP78_22310 [Jeotgalibacillus soli]|uniref:Uncharacterized protein n=1 Tax=Jeotgalibacillus soli TaxID=889306 RepID=A0A0C2VA82_9BACL|nr:hypothetical protein KP78_22310 [Jeotgalibacillus soli]